MRDVSDWPEVAQATCAFTAETPQLYLDLDRRKAESLGVTAKTVFSTLQNKLASFYVNDFNMRGGTYQVVVQRSVKSADRLLCLTVDSADHAEPLCCASIACTAT